MPELKPLGRWDFFDECAGSCECGVKFAANGRLCEYADVKAREKILVDALREVLRLVPNYADTISARDLLGQIDKEEK